MALKLENVTIEDRAAIAEIITEANWDDPWGQAIWPGCTKESRYQGTYARLARTMLGERAWFMKVTENGKPISYAQWMFPMRVWEKLKAENEGGIGAGVTEEMRARFKQQAEETCDANDDPIGMNTALFPIVGPAMKAAHNRVFPQDEEYILLHQVKTLPAHQGKGAGAMLVRWGNEVANKENLNVRLESTSFGRRLYEKCGFENLTDYDVDASSIGGPSKYSWTLMVKRPD